MDNNDVHNELKQHAPRLAAFKKAQLKTSVPDAYLDDLEERLMKRMEHEDLIASQKVTFAFWKKKSVWMAAASLLLVGVLWYKQAPLQSSESIETIAMQLDESEVENYVLLNISDFDAEQLSEYVGESDTEDAAWYEAAGTELDEYSLEDFEDFL